MNCELRQNSSNALFLCPNLKSLNRISKDNDLQVNTEKNSFSASEKKMS